MFPLVNADRENPLELFQIWLNLPAKDKMVKPHFKMFWGAAIPRRVSIDENGRKTTIEVIAGSVGDSIPSLPPPNSWANLQNNEVAIWHINMEAGSTWTAPAASAGLNRAIYYYQGKDLNLAGSTADI